MITRSSPARLFDDVCSSTRRLLRGSAYIVLSGCFGCAASSVTGSLKFLDRNKVDKVGCGAGAFSPDGKKDLNFRLRLDPGTVGVISELQLIRQGQHAGVWHTGSSSYALGVTKVGGATLLGANGSKIQPIDYDDTGFDMAACDDGATGAHDTFSAKIILQSGQSYDTPFISISQDIPQSN